MARKTFTPEEVEILKANPYTAKVTRSQISFTASFKEAFWDAYLTGKGPREIIQGLGYDVDILGQKRITTIAQHIREEAKSGDGFHTGRRAWGQAKTAEEADGDKRLADVEARLEYLEQQMAFLKKAMSVRTGAR